ncbi:hypothetical protein [Alicyclobacillus fastidiosus]|nr:hypothetical protein [Alicyclobacillus fastidiosus]
MAITVPGIIKEAITAVKTVRHPQLIQLFFLTIELVGTRDV